ncbi:MAG: MBL fold metallo-hydrolase [Chloroflexi bacterium]|nr:MAG: MBL fold metallo-hydrolase [Chloroflexota bacterium]
MGACFSPAAAGLRRHRLDGTRLSCGVLDRGRSARRRAPPALGGATTGCGGPPRAPAGGCGKCVRRSPDTGGRHAAHRVSDRLPANRLFRRLGHRSDHARLPLDLHQRQERCQSGCRHLRMLMMELAAGLRRLSNSVSHFYVVEEGGRLTLVDAGKPSDWALLLQMLESRGLSLTAIECVLLTHAHSDHTGFAERARVEAHATVRVHDADAAVARGAKRPKTEGGFTKYLVHGEAYRTLFGLMRGGGLQIVPVTEVHARNVSAVLRGAVVALHGRCAGDTQPHDRPAWPADHAGEPERQLRAGARIADAPRGAARRTRPARARRCMGSRDRICCTGCPRCGTLVATGQRGPAAVIPWAAGAVGADCRPIRDACETGRPNRGGTSALRDTA